MKRALLAIVLLAALPVWAAPFLVSDVLTAGVTQCGVYLDAQAKVTIPVTAVTGGNICKHDLSGISSGAHSVQFTAITVNDPIWGSQESAKSLPLSFSRPGLPAAPAGLVLQP